MILPPHCEPEAYFHHLTGLVIISRFPSITHITVSESRSVGRILLLTLLFVFLPHHWGDETLLSDIWMLYMHR